MQSGTWEIFLDGDKVENCESFILDVTGVDGKKICQTGSLKFSMTEDYDSVCLNITDFFNRWLQIVGED